MTTVEEQIRSLRRRFATRIRSLEHAAEVFAKEHLRLKRIAQTHLLGEMEDRLAQEVYRQQRVRTFKDIGSTAAYAIGHLLTGDSNGLPTLFLEQSRNQGQSVAVVVVGIDGIPDDVHMARGIVTGTAGGGTPTGDVERRFFWPDRFHKAIQMLRDRILAGTMELPVTGAQMASLLTHGEEPRQ